MREDDFTFDVEKNFRLGSGLKSIVQRCLGLVLLFLYVYHLKNVGNDVN